MQELDEMQILHDLMVRMYHDHEARRAVDPSVDAADQAEDPRLKEAIRAMQEDYKSGERGKLVENHWRAQERRPTPRLTKLRLGRGRVIG